MLQPVVESASSFPAVGAPTPVVRRWGWGGFAVTVEVPDGVRRLLRRSRSRGRGDGRLPSCEVRERPPKVEARPFDVDAALVAWRGPHNPTRMSSPAPDLTPERLEDKVASVEWYHTIELPGGIVTPGLFDHRPVVTHYGIPEDLTRKAVLDVATADGFWAFEFERRGADVVALDIERLSQLDLPYGLKELILEKNLDRELGRGFAIAAEALSSRVTRRVGSVYGLDPGKDGSFDIVHIGDVLLHLRDPVAALERVRAVTKEMAIISDSYKESLGTSHLIEYHGGHNLATWWLPSLDTLAQMVLDAGFGEVGVQCTYRLNSKYGPGFWRGVLIARP